MEPLDLVLEASIGYAGAIGVALLDEVASMNEKVDTLVLDAETMRDSRMEDVEEMRNLSRRLSDDREEWLRMFVEERNMRRDLARDHNKLKTLVNSLVGEVGRLTDDLGSLRQRFSRSLPRAAPLVDSARMAAEPIHMLIRHEGRLVEIGEVDRAEDELVPDSTRGSPARDFLAEEEEQAQEARWNNELMSRTQELLTKIRTLSVEIRDIKRTSQKQYIKTPFKGQDRDSLQTTSRCYSNPLHKQEERDGKPDCSHTALTSSSPSSPPTGSSCTQTRCAEEEASSPATYPSEPPSPSPPHGESPGWLSPSATSFEPVGEDWKGYTTGPCSTGIQMDEVLTGRTEG